MSEKTEKRIRRQIKRTAVKKLVQFLQSMSFKHRLYFSIIVLFKKNIK
jgi:hypothetical protein